MTNPAAASPLASFIAEASDYVSDAAATLQRAAAAIAEAPRAFAPYVPPLAALQAAREAFAQESDNAESAGDSRGEAWADNVRVAIDGLLSGIAAPLPPLRMPEVGECYFIRQSIDRFPHGVAGSGQYATVTAVDADTIWLRPATPLDWYEGEPTQWGCVAFYLSQGEDNPTGGLPEFHESCVLQSEAPSHARHFSEKEKADLAEEALNAAVKLIQDRLGVTSGDVAGQYFSGKNALTVSIFADYIRTELQD